MEEVKNFLINKFNQCELFLHDDYPKFILHVYDKSFIREKKIRRVINNYDNINFKVTKDSKILFRQDYENNHFYVRYNEIWSILQNKYNMKYDDIQSLIKTTLLQPDKLRSLTPGSGHLSRSDGLLQPDKLKSLTPHSVNWTYQNNLLQPDKLRSLTPTCAESIIENHLSQPGKLKSLTPDEVVTPELKDLFQPDKLRSLTPKTSGTNGTMYLLQPDKLRSLTPIKDDNPPMFFNLANTNLKYIWK